jgi:hypothetical protein
LGLFLGRVLGLVGDERDLRLCQKPGPAVKHSGSKSDCDSVRCHARDIYARAGGRAWAHPRARRARMRALLSAPQRKKQKLPYVYGSLRYSPIPLHLLCVCGDDLLEDR